MSVELEPRDGWGQHAVAHVMEMQNRRRDGIAWMRDNPEAWSRDSFFAVHNWWHLALFHLGLDEIDEVLALFDGPIHGKTSTVVLEMIDASALLWRLHLRGVDVGDRFQALADNWTPLATARNYAFNDMHAMMAFVGANRSKAADAVLEAQRSAIDDAGDNAAFTREVGHPAALAIKAFGDGDYSGNSSPAATDPKLCASVRRQPRAARCDRPDDHRSRNAFRSGTARRGVAHRTSTRQRASSLRAASAA